MSTASTRVVTTTFTGDFTGTESNAAAANASSPGMAEIKTLASGANTITVPAAGTVPTAVTIVPPVGNANLITLKGVTGDTGVPLHKTDPTTIALDTTCATFCLNAAAQIIGVRFLWS